MSSLCSYAQVVTLIVVLYISVALGKVKNGTCKICRCFFFFFLAAFVTSFYYCEKKCVCGGFEVTGLRIRMIDFGK